MKYLLSNIPLLLCLFSGSVLADELDNRIPN